MTSHLYFEARNYAGRILTYEPQDVNSDPVVASRRVVSVSEQIPAEVKRNVSLSDRFGRYYIKEEDFKYSEGISVDVPNVNRLVDVFVHTGEEKVRDLRTYLQEKRALKAESGLVEEDSDTEAYEIPEFDQDPREENTFPLSKSEEDFLTLEGRCNGEEQDQGLEPAEWPKPKEFYPFERFDKEGDGSSSNCVTKDDVEHQEIPPEIYEIDNEEQRRMREKCDQEIGYQDNYEIDDRDQRMFHQHDKESQEIPPEHYEFYPRQNRMREDCDEKWHAVPPEHYEIDNAEHRMDQDHGEKYQEFQPRNHDIENEERRIMEGRGEKYQHIQQIGCEIDDEEQTMLKEQEKREERQKRIEEEKERVLKKIIAIKERKTLSRKDSIPAKEESSHHKDSVHHSTTTHMSEMSAPDNWKRDRDNRHLSKANNDSSDRRDVETAKCSRSLFIPGTHADSVPISKTVPKSAGSDTYSGSRSKTTKLTIGQYYKRSTSESESEERAKKIVRSVILNDVGSHRQKDLLVDLLGAMKGDTEIDTRNIIKVKTPEHEPMQIENTESERVHGQSDMRQVVTAKALLHEPVGSCDGDIIVVDMDLESESSNQYFTTPQPVVEQSPVVRSPEEVEAQEALESYYKCHLDFEDDCQTKGSSQGGAQPPTPRDTHQTPSLMESHSPATGSSNSISVWDRLARSPALMKAISERPFMNIGAHPATSASTPPFLSPVTSSSFLDSSDHLHLFDKQMKFKDPSPNKQPIRSAQREQHSRDMSNHSRIQQKTNKPGSGHFTDKVRIQPHERPHTSDAHGFDRAHHSKGYSSKDSYYSPISDTDIQYFSSPEYSPQDTCYQLVRIEMGTPLIPDLPLSAMQAQSIQRPKQMENRTKKSMNTTESSKADCSKRPTKPETKGKFHTRTLLMGKGVEARHIPLDPLYLVKPFTSRGEPTMIPTDPRLKLLQKMKRNQQVEEDLYVDALL